MLPRLFTVGDLFTVHTYGLLVALGLLVGIYTASRLAPRVGVDNELIWNLGVYMALAGLLGARLALVVFEWRYFAERPREFFTWAAFYAGGVWHGGDGGSGDGPFTQRGCAATAEEFVQFTGG